MGAPESPTKNDAGGCDFTRPLPPLQPVPSPPESAAAQLAARYGKRYRIRRKDEDYIETLLGDWLSAADATGWRDRLQAEEDAWNPAPGFGNSVYYALDAITPPLTTKGRAAVGDLVIHRIIEMPDDQLLTGDSYTYLEYYQVGIVLAVDARGRVATLRDRSGERRCAQNPHLIAAAQIHAEAALDYLKLRESERGEPHGRYAATFDSPLKAARALSAFIRPGATIMPSLPDRRQPDVRVTRRFPASMKRAEKRPDGSFARIGWTIHTPKHPVVAVEVTEIAAPVSGCHWGIKNRCGIWVIGHSREEMLARASPTLPMEIERGYCKVVPVAVREAAAERAQ